MLGRVSAARFECETCGQTFSQRTNLCHHRAVHQGRTRCPLCGRVFSRTSGLSAHLARRHGDQHQAPGGPHQPSGLLGLPTWIGRQALPPRSGHTCNICGKTFTIRTSLIHHRSLHRGETACPFCQKVFSRKSNMMTHVRTVHAMAPGGEVPPPSLGPVTGGPPALQQ
ncbi:Zinc finger protein 189 [Amphibalanus amphitrite]|uniref:Zinc finger protein 189 n=1 Tax=Amphibalanus amphitrite TaxID=1232801 RepID=A0A6A4XCU4_AMPAM|nr:Zinc finger protein 189 [Amphibalanus amphitrite]